MCDTRRAQAWRDALRRHGLDAALVETAADNDKGGWEVGVAAADAVAGRAFVTEVMQGRARLQPRRSWRVVAAIVVVAILLFVWIAR